MKPMWPLLFSCFIITAALQDEDYTSCQEISTELRFPCLCALGPIETTLDGNPSISVNCDRTVFPGDFPVIPYGAPIVSFSQKWVGHQSLPTQVSSNYLMVRNLSPNCLLMLQILLYYM